MRGIQDSATLEQMALGFYGDIALTFGEAPEPGAAMPMEFSGGAPIAKADGSTVPSALPWSKRMHDGFKDSAKRERIKKQIQEVAIAKIGTGDIGSLLTTSLAERMPWIRNPETPLLNVMEMAPGEELVADDYLYRITERRQGTTRAPRVNPEAPLGAYIDSVYSEKYNILAFWGGPVTSTFVGSAQAKKQRGVDTLRKEVDSMLLRIRKAKNFDYWNGIQQNLFTGTNITQVGGLLSRIFTNSGSAGGGDFSDALGNTANNAIANALGYNGIKALFINPRGVGVVRGIEIARYGGSNFTSYAQFNKIMSQKFSEFMLEPDRVFEPNVGPPIPVFHEFDLPTGPAQAVLMSIEPDYMPKEARFQLGDEFGPWLFVRPVFDLRESVMVLDGGTVDDPAEESRFLFTNLLG